MTEIFNQIKTKLLTKEKEAGFAVGSSPRRGYHIEFSFDNSADATVLCDELAQHDIFAKIVDRRVYIKDSESICNLLALVGANKSLLHLHNQIALRSVRNVSNRHANCDTANIEKQVHAAAAQIATIEKLRESGALETLSPPLAAIVYARLAHPHASYDELAEILHVNKSAIARGLARLCHLP